MVFLFKNLFIITTILLWCIILTSISSAGDYYPIPLVMMPSEINEGARIEKCTIKLYKKDPNEFYKSNLHFSSHIIPTGMIVELQINTVEKNLDNNISIEISDKKSKLMIKGSLLQIQRNNQNIYDKIYCYQFNSSQFDGETVLEFFYKNNSAKLEFLPCDIYYDLSDGGELYSLNGSRKITTNKNYLTIVNKETLLPYDFVLCKDGKLIKCNVGLDNYVETTKSIPKPILEVDESVQEVK